jgi:flagellar basal-body rod protein FlgF
VHSGIYTAYSGLKAQMSALDTLANNLANANTAGFKEQKSFFTALHAAAESSRTPQLDAAINTAVAVSSMPDLTGGSLAETHRDLDLAIVGKGFLTVQTPAGQRYSRNGSLALNAQSVLCTSEGFPVLGERGPIVLGPGKIIINEQGEILVDGARIDRLKIAAFESPGTLICEGGSLFAQPQGAPAAGAASDAGIRQGYLEQSNVNPVLSMVRLVETMRQFEAIQKSIGLMLNEMDAKAIEKLPR